MTHMFTQMTLEQLTDPARGGYFHHLIDHWWPITSNNTVLFYGTARSPYGSPQCNANKDIASRFIGHLKREFAIVDTKLIPVAFQPINLSDYDH